MVKAWSIAHRSNSPAADATLLAIDARASATSLLCCSPIRATDSRQRLMAFVRASRALFAVLALRTVRPTPMSNRQHAGISHAHNGQPGSSPASPPRIAPTITPADGTEYPHEATNDEACDQAPAEWGAAH
jgi:hypothetical protein